MPRFVVLEHVWNGVHWDFMLECGEVLRTWAIDAPIVAGQRPVPARALADHRRIYLDYEGESRAGVAASDGSTRAPIGRLSGRRPGARDPGGLSTGWRSRSALHQAGVGGSRVVDLPHGKLRLKHLARRQDRPVKGPLWPDPTAGEPDLAVANLKFFELHVLSLEIRRITHEDHRISVSSRPFGVNTMVACILDDPVENVVGRDRQDSGANLFESQLDGVAAGYAGPGDDGDHRLDPPCFRRKARVIRSSSKSTRGS